MFDSPWRIWRRHWEIRERPRLFVETMIVVFLAMALPYAIINHLMNAIAWSAFDPVTTIDERIPFIAWSFIIYSTLYLYYPAAAWFGRGNDVRVREMFAFYQTLFILTWVIFLIFILLPTEIHIRNHIPLEIRSGEGLWGLWYGDLMHFIDNPWNAWPSLHVVQSLLIVLILRRWQIIYGIKEAMVWSVWVALCVSILTTKQHFFFDLVTGIAIALLAWFWLFIPALNATTNSKWIVLLPSNSSDE